MAPFFNERLDDLRAQCFADDVEYDASMLTYTDEEAATYFESGGMERPAHASSDATASRSSITVDAPAAPADAPAAALDIADVEVPTGADPRAMAALLAAGCGCGCMRSSAAAAPASQSDPEAVGATCEPCDAAESSAAGPKAWVARDARLLVFLETHALLKLSTPLSTTTLYELEVMDRLDLLSHLKAVGGSTITERQTLANALAKAVKEKTLPPDDVCRPQEPLTCDACDGPHATDECPYFKGKARDDHPDAVVGSGKRSLFGAAMKGPPEVLSSGAARVVRQPGDGSCLFHSLSHGLANGSTARTLRSQICQFIERNEQLEIADSPLSDWVKWDEEGMSVASYCRKLRLESTWGGGIELAAASHLYGVHVLVYEADRPSGGYKRIGAFEPPPTSPSSVLGAVTGAAKGMGSKRTVRIIYQGGVHYDALELSGEAASPMIGKYGLGQYAHGVASSSSGYGGPTSGFGRREISGVGMGGTLDGGSFGRFGGLPTGGYPMNDPLMMARGGGPGLARF